MSNANCIQEGYTAITPYLYAKLELLDFLNNAFGAETQSTPVGGVDIGDIEVDGSGH